MKTLACILCAFVSLLAGTASLSAEEVSRDWTQASSGKTLAGKFLRLEGDKVVILVSGGTSLKLPIAMLTEEDQTYAREADKKASEARAAASAPEGRYKWYDDFEEAKALAASTGKPMLLDFTGSDWCGYCIKLHSEVFDTSEFKSFAKDELILVEIDFPRGKSQSRKLQEQNQALKSQYKVSGYPTIYLVDAKGETLGKTGYTGATPEAYIENLRKMMK